MKLVTLDTSPCHPVSCFSIAATSLYEGNMVTLVTDNKAGHDIPLSTIHHVCADIDWSMQKLIYIGKLLYKLQHRTSWSSHS